MEENEVAVVPETTEEVVEEVEQDIDWKAEALKQKEIAQNQKIRAEKAESKPKTGDLATKDILYIAKAEIHEEDLDEVMEYARIKGIGMNEAHKYLKPILQVREEERKSSEVSNVGAGGRRSPTRVTDDILISRAKAGNLPETDEEIQRLFAARAKQNKN